MRASWLLLLPGMVAGCLGGDAPAPLDEGPGPTGASPADTDGTPWVDLATGLTHNGTGPTALVAEVRLPPTDDCELLVAGEFNSTGHGVQFMTQFREASGGGSMGANHHRQEAAVQAGPLDTRSDGEAGPGWTIKGFTIDEGGTLFVGLADARPLADDEAVPQGTVLVTSACPGAAARWSLAGVQPTFFTSDTADGLALASVAADGAGVVVAAGRGFDRTVETTRAILVANVMQQGAGVLQLTSSAGTETWNLATDSRQVWHEGPGGQQTVAFSQGGPVFVVGALFGVPPASDSG